MKVYTNHPGNLFADYPVITAKFAGVEIEQVTVSGEEAMAEYKKNVPTARFPALQTEDGWVFESSAISRHFARLAEGKNLLGDNAYQNAVVDQWLDFSLSTLLPQTAKVVYPVFGYGTHFDQAEYNDNVKGFKDMLRMVDGNLKGKEWFAGDHLTLADIQMAMFLIVPFQVALDAGYRKAIPNLSAWFEKMVKKDEFVSVIGNFKFCKRVMKVTAPKAEEKKGGKKEAPKPKEAEKPKEEQKKKEGNPLDSLPPSKLDLNSFKDWFCNLPDRHTGMEKFWSEMYDPEGYCIYFIHYERFGDEGQVLYKTQNLHGGFLQRIDHFRKHVFSNLGIYGEEPDLEIMGVWMFRGQGIPQEMIDHPQFEYYKQRKLDHNSEEDRKLIEEMWCNKIGETCNGLVMTDGKLHK